MNNEKQPNANSFLWKLDNLKEKFGKKIQINPLLLVTKNRKDVELRKKFLEDVFDKKIEYKKTLYYHFISDSDKGIGRESMLSCKNFQELFHNISENGIKEPLLVTKITSDFFKSRYILKNKKIWKSYKNETNYQLIQGAHRLAIAIYLKLNSVPVKIFSPTAFEIPNYTDYIELKEPTYRKLIKNGEY